MIASFSSFKGQGPQAPWDSTQQGIRMLRQLDGSPGDRNPVEKAVSMPTSLGQLDAVILTNQDGSETVVQRLRKKDGVETLSWLEVPQQGNGVPNLGGFEVTRVATGEVYGSSLVVEEAYGSGAYSVIPRRTYVTSWMNQPESQNALMRAESVLVGFGA
jgi:hypothetical protein